MRCSPVFLSLFLFALTSCAGNANRDDDYLPRIGGDSKSLENSANETLQQLQLVSTNFVSAMLQIPELNPALLTLQVSRPNTAFGNTLVRALEDAGYGLQRVSADQGRHYVTYSHRFSETEAGPVTDFELRVGDIDLHREFVIDSSRIFPSSLMSVNGIKQHLDIVLDDDVFREQGGETQAFISGVSGGPNGISAIHEVKVNAYDETPKALRTTQASVLDNARKRMSLNEASQKRPEMSNHERIRRTVLIFDNTSTRIMGAGNKLAVRLLVRDRQVSDIFVVTACTDADGQNDEAVERGIRVEEEFVSHGVPADSVWLAPCVRASYRHASDDSAVPVEVVQHRQKL
ncbi:MAG: hypothetical protein V3U76_06745 [Granulosicoccus sp.]